MSDSETAFVEVVPDFSRFRRDAQGQMTDVLGNAGAAGGIAAGSRMNGGIIAAIGKIAAPVAAALAALGIADAIGGQIRDGVQYGLDGIELASDLAETKSAITQVFTDASDDILKFAESANTALGQTQQQALSAAQTFGVFAQAAGLTDKPLADFSTGLVTLATDLASFYDTDPQQAIDAISAGLRGESEPLRQYGILLDDATLKQAALTLGIYDGTGSLTQQQRVLAAQAEIYRQSTIAQGDFARTSGGLAGQQKELAASLQDIQTKLGEALLPAMTELVTLANDELIPVFSGVIDQVGPELAKALADSAPAITEMILSLAPLLPQLVELGTELLPLLVQGLIVAAPLLIDMASNTTAWYAILNGIIDLIKGDTTFTEFAANVSALGGSVTNTAEAIGTGLSGLVIGFANFVASVMNTAIDAINGVNKAIVAAVNAVSEVTGLSAKYVAIPRIQLQSAEAKATRFQLEDGGFFGARPGGYAATIAEAGHDEVALPLSQEVFRKLGQGIADASGSIGSAVQVHLTNKTGSSLTELIDLRIQQNGLWTSIDLDGGITS